MPFCAKCGKQLEDSTLFCPACGTPVKQAPVKSDIKQEFSGSSVVVKYEKSPIFMMLVEPLSVSLDGQLNFSVVDGREVCYNISQGNYTINAYVPYIGGSKYGAVKKSFYVGNNETWEITYRPPAAIFMTGNINIRRMS